MNAYLILENGKVFKGKSIGATGEVICELVFNTAMTGQQDILSDSVYAGQGIVMTYPLIGNYGFEPVKNYVKENTLSAFIVRETARKNSNFDSKSDASEFLSKCGVMAVCDVDTRAITKILRESGTMNAMVTTNPDFNVEEILPKIKAYKVGDAVSKASTGKTYSVGEGKKVVLIDMGSKGTIVDSLIKRGCEVTVVPYNTKAEDIIKLAPCGVVVSNGGGDPKNCKETIEALAELLKTDIPMFGISLGHQLIALAAGADTYKLKYGHHGSSQPVKDMKTGEVYVTSQGHGYAVSEESLDKNKALVTYKNLNDSTVEGVEYTGKKVFTVQFIPVSSPGPRDTDKLFDKFVDMI